MQPKNQKRRQAQNIPTHLVQPDRSCERRRCFFNHKAIANIGNEQIIHKIGTIIKIKPIVEDQQTVKERTHVHVPSLGSTYLQ